MNKIILIIFVFVFCKSLKGQTDTIINVFNNAEICFGDSINKPAYNVDDKGRKISNRILIPQLVSPVRIIANLKIKSLGDKWDRFGSVYFSAGNEKIELVKFMTGFGTGNQTIPLIGGVEKWEDEMNFTLDLSYLSPLFKDSVTINAFIDTWVEKGWQVNFTLTFRTDIYAMNPKKVIPVMNITGDYLNYKTYDAGGIFDTLLIDKSSSKYLLYFYSSGHGGDSAGDEFNMKENIITINNNTIHIIPWRDDCRRFRSLNPTSAKWEGDLWSSDLSRSGWCPGDLSLPYIYNVTDKLNQGLNYFNFNILNSDRTTDVLDYWNLSAFILEY